MFTIAPPLIRFLSFCFMCMDFCLNECERTTCMALTLVEEGVGLPGTGVMDSSK